MIEHLKLLRDAARYQLHSLNHENSDFGAEAAAEKLVENLERAVAAAQALANFYRPID